MIPSSITDAALPYCRLRHCRLFAAHAVAAMFQPPCSFDGRLPPLMPPMPDEILMSFSPFTLMLLLLMPSRRCSSRADVATLMPFHGYAVD